MDFLLDKPSLGKERSKDSIGSLGPEDSKDSLDSQSDEDLRKHPHAELMEQSRILSQYCDASHSGTNMANAFVERQKERVARPPPDKRDPKAKGPRR